MQDPASTSAPATLPFAFVDVFASAPLTGNPLAVVADGEALTDEQMQRIAGEFNQAETTFVLRPTRAEADWRLRSFTAAGVEVYGAGHNSLGAWWWLAASGQLVLTHEVTTCLQEIGTATLPVEIRSEAGAPASVALTQEAPVFGRQAGAEQRAALAAALRLEPSALDEQLPVRRYQRGRRT
jgi:PhzF family phenazine biosynthesis protein